MEKKQKKEEKESETHIAVFHGKGIRRKLVNDKWFFSVVDVIEALTDSKDPNDYWYRLKQRDKESSETELSTFCRQLRLVSSDGKEYETDCADTEGIFRIIQSIPSKKAEPFKRWLARVGYERIQEIEKRGERENVFFRKAYKDLLIRHNNACFSDSTESLDEHHALSPRYLLRDMPGFIFTFSGRFA